MENKKDAFLYKYYMIQRNYLPYAAPSYAHL